MTTIHLGGADYTIAPLTLGQMRALSIGLAETRISTPLPPPPPGGDAAAPELTPAQARENEQMAWDRMISVVTVALSRSHPEMTQEALLETETTLAELGVAYRTIMQLAGLMEARETPGEPATPRPPLAQ